MTHHKPSDRARVRLPDAASGKRKDVYLGTWGTPEARRRYEATIAAWLGAGRVWPASGEAAIGESGHASKSFAASELSTVSGSKSPDPVRPDITDEADLRGWFESQHRDFAGTVAEVALAYYEHAQSYYVKGGQPTRTLWAVKTAMQLLLDDPQLALAPANSMGSRMVMMAAATLAMRTRDDGSPRYTRSTINDLIGQIKRMAQFGMQWELITPDAAARVQCAPRLRKGRAPAPGVPAPREGRKVRPADVKLVERTLPALPPMLAAMARLQLATAMRPIEVCAMKPEQIFESEHPGVHEYRVGDEGWKLAHTEGEERIVFLGPGAMMILRPFLARAAREGRAYVFSPAASEADRRAMMHAQRATPLKYGNRPGTNKKRAPRRAPGERYDTGAYAAAIRRACDQLGITRWSPNQLRHTAATRIARLTSLNEARLMLGHSDIATTTIYADADRELARGVAAKIG